VSRYTNPKTAQQYRAELTALFAHTGASHPRALTDAAVNHWVAKGRANNTRRNRLARICTFLRWCVRQGEADPALVEELQSRDDPLRATPPLYGKLQGKYPARWLTYAEAYANLLGVCDGSDVGQRDEVVLRLGLAGMRVSEIIHLLIGDIQLGQVPMIQWIGKKNRLRKVTVGPSLLALLDNYLDRYVDGLGRPLRCRATGVNSDLSATSIRWMIDASLIGLDIHGSQRSLPSTFQTG
jgi:integrase